MGRFTRYAFGDSLREPDAQPESAPIFQRLVLSNQTSMQQDENQTT